MMTQKQAKILRQPTVLQQSSKRLLDGEQVTVDGAFMETVAIALATLNLLQDTFGLRIVNLPSALDKGDPYSYINNVRRAGLNAECGLGRVMLDLKVSVRRMGFLRQPFARHDG